MIQGSIAESIVAKAQATGGILTMADMANYSVIVAPALEGSFAGRRVLTSGAPTSGAVLLHMLHLADRLGLVQDSEGLSEEEQGEQLHLMIECMKCMSLFLSKRLALTGPLSRLRRPHSHLRPRIHR
jgi:gamma-glutamyltranspeptidase/glutathione hydrolase/leukotriene-C4 hydrolase